MKRDLFASRSYKSIVLMLAASLLLTRALTLNATTALVPQGKGGEIMPAAPPKRSKTTRKKATASREPRPTAPRQVPHNDAGAQTTDVRPNEGADSPPAPTKSAPIITLSTNASAVADYSGFISHWMLELEGAPGFSDYWHYGSAFAFSPDGETFAIEGRRGIEIFDVHTGEIKKHVEVSLFSIKKIVYSPDGKLLAVDSDPYSETPMELWDTTTWKPVRTFKGHVVAFSSDSRTLASWYDNRILLWDVQTGTPQRVLPISGYVSTISFSPDGRTMAIKDGGSVRLWDTQSWKSLDRSEIENAIESSAYLNPITFLPDSQTLIVGGKLWSTKTGRFITTVAAANGSENSIVFSPDGGTAANLTADGGIKLWSTQTGSVARDIGTSGLLGLTFSPDSKTLIGVNKGAINFWRVLGPSDPKDEELSYWETTKNSSDPEDFKAYLRKYPDGRFTKLAEERAGLVLVRTLPLTYEKFTLSADGRWLATVRDAKGTDGTILQDVSLWDAQAGGLKGSLKITSWDVDNLAFSPDGKLLAFAARQTPSHKVFLYDVQAIVTAFEPSQGAAAGKDRRNKKTREAAPALELTLPSDEHVSSLVIAPNDLILAVEPDRERVLGSELTLWNIQTRELKHKLRYARSPVFSPDSTLLVDTGLRLWDVETGEVRQKLSRGNRGVNWQSFSPDGAILISGFKASEENYTDLTLWDIQSGKPKQSVRLNTEELRAVFLSDDAKTLKTIDDKQIRFWDVNNGELKRTLKVPPGSWSPDGRMFVTGDEKSLKFWQMLEQ